MAWETRTVNAPRNLEAGRLFTARNGLVGVASTGAAYNEDVEATFGAVLAFPGDLAGPVKLDEEVQAFVECVPEEAQGLATTGLDGHLVTLRA